MRLRWLDGSMVQATANNSHPEQRDINVVTPVAQHCNVKNTNDGDQHRERGEEANSEEEELLPTQESKCDADKAEQDEPEADGGKELNERDAVQQAQASSPRCTTPSQKNLSHEGEGLLNSSTQEASVRLNLQGTMCNNEHCIFFIGGHPALVSNCLI